MNTQDLINKLLNNPDASSDFTSVAETATQLDRIVMLAEIDEDTGIAVDNHIRFWNRADDELNIPIEQRKPIKIIIDSPGGLITSTLTMIDAIKASKTPIWTVNIGCAYSGGFLTFIAGHKRIAYPHSSFLFHEGSSGFAADAGKFRNFAEFYEKQLDQLKEIILEYTNITEEYYDKHQKDDVWLTAKEALEFGICDEIGVPQ